MNVYVYMDGKQFFMQLEGVMENKEKRGWSQKVFCKHQNILQENKLCLYYKVSKKTLIADTIYKAPIVCKLPSDIE